jgi:hypothetical protein
LPFSRRQALTKRGGMETGCFLLQGNQFVAGGSKFVLKRRKKPTPNKPELFLIQLQPFKYISSLFPAGEEGLYTFDYERQLYILKIGEAQVVIAEEE